MRSQVYGEGRGLYSSYNVWLKHCSQTRGQSEKHNQSAQRNLQKCLKQFCQATFSCVFRWLHHSIEKMLPISKFIKLSVAELLSLIETLLRIWHQQYALSKHFLE